MLRITNHRRYTANHTWHVDWAGETLFVKANPHHDEAHAECAGHARIREFYPVPRLRRTRRVGPWTVIVYDRWQHLGRDRGLLLDEITRADLTGDTRRLDVCLNALLGHYTRVIGQTLRHTNHGDTIGKIYGGRAAPHGRLDQYYRTNAPWPITAYGAAVRPSDLAGLRLVVNGQEHAVDVADLTRRLRAQFVGEAPVWAALTQGDPTDLNLGWSPECGPVWFDYDTGGLNALPGEFACFLLYQRLHGAWLTPLHHQGAFLDHPSALDPASLVEPRVHVEYRGSTLVINYRHAPSPTRQYVMRRYLDEVVRPIARELGIADLMTWLRPYLVMRLLAVYDLSELEPRDVALSLALLAQVTDPAAALSDALALVPSNAEVD